MAVAVGSVSNTPTYGSRTNSTITAPTGITNGDLLVAVLHVGDATALPPLTVTPPTGWTEVTNSPTSAANPDPYTVALHVYYKVASSESGNYTFTHTSADTEGYMYRLTGADTTTPIDTTPVKQTSIVSNPQTTGYPSITTVTNGAFLIYGESDWDAAGTGTISGSTPTISTRRVGAISYIADGTLATAGATGARTRTNGNTNGGLSTPWASIIVPIRPASGGTSVNLTGASVSALAGTVSPQASNSITLTGASVSALAGTAAPSIGDSVNLNGASCAAQAGQITPTAAPTVAGASCAALAGAVATQTDDSAVITGAACSALAGTVTPTVLIPAIGAACAAIAGGVSEQISAAPSGAAVSALAGSVTAGPSAIINGAAATALAGSVAATVSGSVSLTGAACAAVAGDVSTTAGGGSTVNITGAACAALAGGVASIAQKTLTGAMAAALAGIVVTGVLAQPIGAAAAALAGPVSIGGSTQVAITGAACAAIAGDVTPRIIVTYLNPNYIAVAPRRMMVAMGLPRSMVAVAQRRNRIVVGISNQMAQTNMLVPPIDAVVETETVTFDFGLLIVPGVELTGAPTITCQVFSGVDPDAASRIIGDWQLGVSPNSGQPNAAIFQRFGQMLGGVTYRLQCVMNTTDNQDLSVWSHLPCQTPN